MLKRKKNFTFIEIMIVVSIMAILGAFFSSRVFYSGVRTDFNRNCDGIQRRLLLLREASITNGCIVSVSVRNDQDGIFLESDYSSKFYEGINAEKEEGLVFSPSGCCDVCSIKVFSINDRSLERECRSSPVKKIKG